MPSDRAVPGRHRAHGHNLQRDLRLSYPFITHNIGVVEAIDDRMAVMRVGQVDIMISSPGKETIMAQFTVRNIEDDVKARLKRRAARHGHSMEAEVRQILRNAVNDEVLRAGPGLGSRIAARFARGGLAEPLPELRGQAPRPAEFDA
jgi:plasmid stability protein